MSYDFIPLDFIRLESEAQRRRAVEFYDLMKRRRTVREFSPEPVPFELWASRAGCCWRRCTTRGW